MAENWPCFNKTTNGTSRVYKWPRLATYCVTNVLETVATCVYRVNSDNTAPYSRKLAPNWHYLCNLAKNFSHLFPLTPFMMLYRSSHVLGADVYPLAL